MPLIMRMEWDMVVHGMRAERITPGAPVFAASRHYQSTSSAVRGLPALPVLQSLFVKGMIP